MLKTAFLYLCCFVVGQRQSPQHHGHRQNKESLSDTQFTVMSLRWTQTSGSRKFCRSHRGQTGIVPRSPHRENSLWGRDSIFHHSLTEGTQVSFIGLFPIVMLWVKASWRRGWVGGRGWGRQCDMAEVPSSLPSPSWDTSRVSGEWIDSITIFLQGNHQKCYLPHLYFRKHWEVDGLRYALWENARLAS